MSDRDYDPSLIEAAIQKSWKEDDVYRATSSSSKEKVLLPIYVPLSFWKITHGSC